MEKLIKNVMIEYMDVQTMMDANQEIIGMIREIKEQLKPQPIVEYITREQVAEIFGVTLATVNNWKNLGIIQAYNIGKQVRYIKDEVLKSPIPIRVKKK